MATKTPRQPDLGDRTGETAGLRGNSELLHAMGNELGAAMAAAELVARDDAAPPAVREAMNTVVAAISRTEELRGELRLGSTDARDTADLLACQTEVLELVARKAPLSATLAALAGGMERQMPGTHCSILLFDPDESRLHHGAAPTLPASYTTEIDGMAIGPVAGSCGTAAYTRRPVFVSDILADERWAAFRAIGARHGLRACWSYPVISPSGSDVLGTFAVYHRSPHRPGVEERLVVERFTHLAAVAIEHHQLFNALHESEARFRGAFTDAAVGMALVDRDGRLAHVNTALCTETGRDLDELFGAAADALFQPDSAAEVRQALSRIVSGELDSYCRDHDFRHADGSRRAACLLLSPVKDAEGRLRLVCLQLRDITDRLRIHRERQAREAAERANLVKSEFVSQLSHEMRTPLNAVVGFAELLHGSAFAPEAAEHARHIIEAGTHLEKLIEDTLCMTRAEAGRLPMHFEPLDPGEIAREAIAFTQPFAARTGVELRAPTGPAPCAVADRHRLRQVLLNLLTNAIKYNRPGGRVVVRTQQLPDRVRITVEDTGRGIGSAALARVFTPFERPGAVHDDPAGIGLGLALTKKLVTAMGGSIGVDSEVDVGTAFRVDLPAREAAPVAASRNRRRAEPVVLYLHGDPHSIDTVAQAHRLRPLLGLRCAYQCHGDVDELLRHEHPDIVVLDVDGSERSLGMLEVVRRNPATAGRPVVCLAAADAEIPRGDGEARTHVLRGPADVDELVDLLDREVRLTRGEQE